LGYKFSTNDKNVGGFMRLTIEQRDIIELLKQGKTNAYIAQVMFLSVSTIERRLSDLYLKFGAENRASFVVEVLALENAGML